MITFDDVSFTYQGSISDGSEPPVLRHIHFHAERGECIVLCGKSGCGKTTMLRMVNGLVPHFYQGCLEGDITVGNVNIKEASLPQIAAVAGSVFQNPRTQFFHLDTTGEMAFNMENLNVPHDKMVERLKETAWKLDIQALMDRDIFQLSGGEKQQIACGSVYASMPAVIVMDEPSSNLDMESIRKLQDLIRTMKDEGKTILISEHRLWYLEDIADRYVLLNDGQIEHEFTGDEILTLSSRKLEQAGLRAVRPEQIWNTGRHTIKQKNDLDETAFLEIEGLQFSRQMKQVLDINRLAIPKGAIVAVIGENGAGKSTFALCLCGLLKHHGTVRINGERIPNKKLSEQTYLVMQEPGHQLFSDSVLGELMLNNGTITETEAADVLEKIGLAGLGKRHPGALSGGQQQRLSLGVALCMNRKIMLYDEPTSGQDGSNLMRTAK